MSDRTIHVLIVSDDPDAAQMVNALLGFTPAFKFTTESIKRIKERLQDDQQQAPQIIILIVPTGKEKDHVSYLFEIMEINDRLPILMLNKDHNNNFVLLGEKTSHSGLLLGNGLTADLVSKLVFLLTDTPSLNQLKNKVVLENGEDVPDMADQVVNKSVIVDLIDRYLLSYSESPGVTALYINLKNVRSVNAFFGHDYGDLLLKTMAQRIHKIFPKVILVARYEGCGFIVLLESTTPPNNIETSLSKAHHLLTQPIKLVDHRHVPSVSIGVALYPADARLAKDLIDRAYQASFTSEEELIEGYSFYSARDFSKQVKNYLENDLQLGLRNHEFELLYQPQYNFDGRKIIGAEALIRWNNPRFGYLMPDYFIPIAENTGLVELMGEWIFHQACQRLRAWIDAGVLPKSFFLSVNISFVQLQKKNMVDVLFREIEKYKINPSMLHLELTESTLIRNTALVLENLRKLKEHGFVLTVDDFGTGYSSLSYISRLPIDVIKIDRSFIRDSEHLTTQSVIKSIINLAHDLDLIVTAEGVETVEQLRWLGKHGCDRVQGFLLSHPLPESQLLEQFSKKKNNKAS